jgi:hypothetical protein
MLPDMPQPFASVDTIFNLFTQLILLGKSNNNLKQTYKTKKIRTFCLTSGSFELITLSPCSRKNPEYIPDVHSRPYTIFYTRILCLHQNLVFFLTYSSLVQNFFFRHHFDLLPRLLVSCLEMHTHSCMLDCELAATIICIFVCIHACTMICMHVYTVRT